MAPVKETTPGPSPLSDIKNLLKELHEKVDRLEAKVEAKAAGKDDKKLRMILIGPPGAGTSSSTLSYPTTTTQLRWIPLSTYTFCPSTFSLSFLTVRRWRRLFYSGDPYWTRKKKEKDQLSCFYFLGGTFRSLIRSPNTHRVAQLLLSVKRQPSKTEKGLGDNRKWK